MPRPVAHITSPPEPLEVRIKRLRIPKVRQKQLRAMMDEVWAQLRAEKQSPADAETEREEKIKNASAAD